VLQPHVERENLILECEVSTYLWETHIGVSSVDYSMVHSLQWTGLTSLSTGLGCTTLGAACMEHSYSHARRCLRGLGWDLAGFILGITLIRSECIGFAVFRLFLMVWLMAILLGVNMVGPF